MKTPKISDANCAQYAVLMLFVLFPLFLTAITVYERLSDEESASSPDVRDFEATYYGAAGEGTLSGLVDFNPCSQSIPPMAWLRLKDEATESFLLFGFPTTAQPGTYSAAPEEPDDFTVYGALYHNDAWTVFSTDNVDGAVTITDYADHAGEPVRGDFQMEIALKDDRITVQGMFDFVAGDRVSFACRQ